MTFQTPFHVNLLISGYDDESQECELYVMDYLASMVKAPYAAHGYGGFFTTALLDRHYRKGSQLWPLLSILSVYLALFFLRSDMTKEEAYELLKECVREVQKRLIINLPNFQVQVIDKKGIEEMKEITTKDL